MPLLRTPFFAAHPHLFHGFATRALPVRSAFYERNKKPEHKTDAEIEENRRLLLESTAFPSSQLSLLKQVHGAEVAIITADSPQEEPAADAQVTQDPGVLLCILTADCVPVLFYDPGAQIIGAAHAGWRGALEGVIDRTIHTMQQLGAKPERIQALIGPCIHQPSYEVGPEVHALFTARKQGYADYFIPSTRDGHYLFDLPGLVASQLEEQRIAAHEAVPENTYTQPERWYSYRLATHRQEPYPGSIASMIGMIKK